MNQRNRARAVVYALGIACALQAHPLLAQGRGSKTHIKTVFVILMENHNWTGNNAGAAFADPDIKGNPLAPYINGPLLQARRTRSSISTPLGTIPACRITCGSKQGPTSEF